MIFNRLAAWRSAFVNVFVQEQLITRQPLCNPQSESQSKDETWINRPSLTPKDARMDSVSRVVPIKDKPLSNLSSTPSKVKRMLGNQYS